MSLSAESFESLVAGVPRLVDGVMVVSRGLLAASMMGLGLLLPVDILDVWFTRDGDAVLLLSGELPGQEVNAIMRRRDDGTAEFVSWLAER